MSTIHIYDCSVVVGTRQRHPTITNCCATLQGAKCCLVIRDTKLITRSRNDVWDIGTMLEKIGVDDPTLYGWDAEQEDWEQDGEDDLPVG